MGFAVLLFFVGDFIGGIWIALIAWFVMGSARSEVAAELIAGPLAHTTVGDVMDDPGETVASDEPSSQTLQKLLRARRRFAAVTQGEALAGIVSISDFAKLHDRSPGIVPISEIMTPFEAVVSVSPATSALDAFRRLADSGHAQVPVVDADGRLRGFITRETALRVFRLAQDRPRVRVT